jgi:iron complex outermembrane receptor protein
MRRNCLIILAFVGSLVTPAHAQQGPKGPQDLSSLTIEDLMNIEVTSVSKREEKLSRTASAIFVITQEDIQHSGATNIPDLLRMVPGLDVAQIDGSTWAISARGFNQQSSDKLLVLIDGRTVYSPLFSGVQWDAQGVPLENIDRIEVIRGPGASVWGANAVDGVISIITKKADQTQGGLVSGGGGTNEQGFGTVRYGGMLGARGAYRISSNYSNHSHLPDPSGQSGEDAWNALRADLRAEYGLTAKDSATVDISGYRGGEGERVPTVTSISPPVNQVLDLRQIFSGWSILSRWDHVFSARSDTSLQVYFDKTDRSDPTYGEGFSTFDLDFQHHLQWGTRQNIVWGLGYRHIGDATQGTLRVVFTPAAQTDQIFSGFLQDEIAIRPDSVYVTLGGKLEHNDFTGFVFQPSARIAWVANEHTMLWSSVSVAKRTPSFADIGVQFTQFASPGPGGLSVVAVAFGNPLEKDENLLATEAGLRREFGDRVSLDVTTFFNHYTGLRSTEPGAAFLESDPAPLHIVLPFVFSNLMHGETHGAEVAVKWKVSNRWTLSPGYAFLLMHMHPDPASQSLQAGFAMEGSSPAHQAQLRSHLVLPGQFQFDVSGYFVGRLPAQNVPSYTRLDAGMTWEPGERFSFSLVGQNLLQDHHLETTNPDLIIQSNLMKRSGYAKIVWHF